MCIFAKIFLDLSLKTSDMIRVFYSLFVNRSVTGECLRSALLPLLLTALLTISGNVQGQSNKPLLFRGNAVEGPARDFAQQLKKQGYTYIGKQDQKEDGCDVTLLSGTFATQPCSVALLSKQGMLLRVKVIFSQMHDSWESLNKSYFELRSFYVEKYGEPSQQIHEFDESRQYGEIYFVRQNKCHYEDIFTVSGGIIILNITNKAMVSVTYATDAVETQRRQTIRGDI